MVETILEETTARTKRQTFSRTPDRAKLGIEKSELPALEELLEENAKGA